MMSVIDQLSVIAADLAPLALSFLWQSTLFILFAGAISILLRKRGPVIRLSLWIAVMLVIPLIPLTMQIANYVDAPTAELSVLPSAMYELSVSPSGPEAEASSAAQPAPWEAASPFESANPYFFVLLIYAVGAGALFTGIAFATIRIRLWERTGKQLSHGRIVNIVNEYLRMFGIKRNVRIIEHSKVAVPCTTGIWRPVIFVPESYGEKLSEEQISSVICHECAHIKRHDVSILAVSSIIRGLIWIQPLVWMIQRKIAILAEQSADELVLATGTNPASYATTLTSIAQEHVLRHSKILSPIGFIDFRHTFLYRVRAILKYTKVDTMSWRGYSLLAVSLLIMISAVTVVPLTEQNVSAADNGDGTVTLNLVVKDIYTKLPIGGVKLEARQWDLNVHQLMSEATTDENGKASLPGIKKTLVNVHRSNDEEYPWVVAKPNINYFKHRIDRGISLDARKIKINKTIILYMEKSAVVRGIVINPEGHPVSGATVYYQPARPKPFFGRPLSVYHYYMVETDENGKYSINIPGNDSRGARLFAQDGKLREWRTWANGVSSETFDLKSRESVKDVAIRLTRPGTISGVVKDKNGFPVPDITVSLKYPGRRNNRNHIPSAKTDVNGRFTILNIREGKMFVICNRGWSTIYHPTKCEWPEGYLVPVTLREGETVTDIEVLGLTIEEVRAIESNNSKKSRSFWARGFKKL